MEKGDTNIYSIKEVSEITGVISVTLRAWERRYGLIKPKRSEKGYRYYTDEDIEQIQKILSWLNKGVAISKVRPLLTSTDMAEPAVEQAPELSAMMDALEQFNSKKLKAFFSETLKNYPHEAFDQFIFTPIESFLLNSNRPDAAILKSLWNTVVIERCASLMASQPEKNYRRRLIIQIGEEALARAWFSALQVVEQGTYSLVLSNPGIFLTPLSSFCDPSKDHLTFVGHYRLDEKQLEGIKLLHDKGFVMRVEGSIQDIHRTFFDTLWQEVK
jgi:DNA-binding transcriptional MerR regulator